MKLIQVIAATMLLAMSSVTGSATTVTDPTLYSNLDVDTSHALSGFNLAGAVSGPATLELRYGVWNGSGLQTAELTVTFNGTALVPAITFSNAYFSGGPIFASFDVSSLVVSGFNSLSVFAHNIADVGQFAVGEISLEYVGAGAVPVPAALPLFASGLGLLGFAGWRRRRKTAA